MDQNDFLAAIADAVKRKQAGEDPEADAKPSPFKNRIVPPSNPNDMPVAPPKPDPEAAANSQLMGKPAMMPSSNPQLPPGMTMEQARQTVNPATGLPYSIGSQASPEDQAKYNLKMQYLKKLQGL
jgi:hypothetical protein